MSNLLQQQHPMKFGWSWKDYLGRRVKNKRSTTSKFLIMSRRTHQLSNLKSLKKIEAKLKLMLLLLLLLHHLNVYLLQEIRIIWPHHRMLFHLWSHALASHLNGRWYTCSGMWERNYWSGCWAIHQCSMCTFVVYITTFHLSYNSCRYWQMSGVHTWFNSHYRNDWWINYCYWESRLPIKVVHVFQYHSSCTCNACRLVFVKIVAW